MNTQLSRFLAFLIMLLSGCRRCDTIIDTTHYVRVRIDPNSADIFVTAMMPAVNQMNECQSRLISKMAWISNNLDKCLEKLEAERGLEPIPRKGYYLRGDPNFAPPPESWYEPYEPGKWHPTTTYSNVNALILSMNLRSLNMCNLAQGMNDYIENFEQRMKRLEKYLAEPKDTNITTIEK